MILVAALLVSSLLYLQQQRSRLQETQRELAENEALLAKARRQTQREAERAAADSAPTIPPQPARPSSQDLPR